MLDEPLILSNSIVGTRMHSMKMTSGRIYVEVMGEVDSTVNCQNIHPLTVLKPAPLSKFI